MGLDAPWGHLGPHHGGYLGAWGTFRDMSQGMHHGDTWGCAMGTWGHSIGDTWGRVMGDVPWGLDVPWGALGDI